MASRSDAATDRVSLASAPTVTSLTVMGWGKVVNTVSPFFHQMVRFSDASGNSSLILGFTGTNGRTPRSYSTGSPTGIVAAAESSNNQWMFMCSTHSGSSAQLFSGTTPGTLAKVTGTVTVGTPNQLTLFSRSSSDGSEWLDGSLNYFRIYTAVLSDTEIATESTSATAVRTSNLWVDLNMNGTTLTDLSGNSRVPTAGTTPLTADTDPLLTTLKPSYFFFG